jgi:hypothetical protein
MAVSATYTRHRRYGIHDGHFSTLVAEGQITITGAETDTDTVIFSQAHLDGLEILNGRWWYKTTGTFVTSFLPELMLIQDAPIAHITNLAAGPGDNAARTYSIPFPQAKKATASTSEVGAESDIQLGDFAATTVRNDDVIYVIGTETTNTRIVTRVTTVGAGTILTHDFVLHVNCRNLGGYVPLS